MEAKTRERKTPSKNGDSDMQEIVKLVDAFGAFRETNAERHGALTQQLAHIEDRLKAFDGIVARVSVVERDIALIHASETAADIRIREWRDESIKDRTDLRNSVEALEKATNDLRGQLMFYAGAIAVLSIVAQVVLKLVFHV